jgi:hypothetical protein
MEIGPITGVRAPSLLSVQRMENAQPPVFEIESSARTGDETYSSSHQAPDRGLEDEGSDMADDDENGPEAPPLRNGRGAKVDFFA